MGHQGMVGWRGLFDENIQGSARHLPGIQRRVEVGFVDDPAACRIDDQHPALAFRKSLGVEQPRGVLGLGHVHGDDVRAREQRVELHLLDIHPRCRLGGEKGIGHDHPHAQPSGPAHHDAPDVAGTHNAEGAVEEFGALELFLLPLARLQGSRGLGNVARQGDHQRQGVLGGGDVVALGRVHHHDAPGGGRGDVDVVDADARPADHLQLLGPGDHVRRDLGAAADHQALDVGDEFEQFVGADPGALDHLEPGRLLEHLDALRRKRIRYEDLRHLASPRALALGSCFDLRPSIYALRPGLAQNRARSPVPIDVRAAPAREQPASGRPRCRAARPAACFASCAPAARPRAPGAALQELRPRGCKEKLQPSHGAEGPGECQRRLAGQGANWPNIAGGCWPASPIKLACRS